MNRDSEFARARAALLEEEQTLKEGFQASAGALVALVDNASALLMTVMLKTPGEASVDLDNDGAVVGGDAGALHLLAEIAIGVRGLRTIRAGLAVLTSGWEPEARAHDRILVELAAHRTAILEDPSGTEALAWLSRRRLCNISRLVRQMVPGDLYANLSTDSHGDPAPVERLLDPESGVMQIEPRRTSATGASLWLYAGFARDQAVVIADLAGIDLRGLDELDRAIREAQPPEGGSAGQDGESADT